MDDRARHLFSLFGEQSIVVSTWGASHFHRLARNKGIYFQTSGNRHRGLVKVRYNDIEDNYSIVYIPNGRGNVFEQKGVKEEDLINELSDKIGQSPFVLDLFLDMYLI